jgi:F-type H+-transporting ATPase subunit delta
MAAVASRYARALADVVFSAKIDPAKTVQDLKEVAELLQSSRELKLIWDNPAVDPQQKHKLLDAIAALLGMARQLRNFIAIVIDRRRLSMLPHVIEQLQAELNERLGLADAEVISARTLGSDERTILEAQISKATRKTVRAHYEEDKALLGGAVVKVGSTIYDGSVRGQLQKMKAAIAGQ